MAAHALDGVEDVFVLGRLVSRERHELGDVHALVAHPLHAANDVQQRGQDPQVAGHRRLACEQRQHALVHLEVASVDPVVVGHDHPGQLHVLIADRLQRAVERLGDEVQAAQSLLLEVPEGLTVRVADLLHVCYSSPGLPIA